MMIEPGESAFNDPTPRQDQKAFLVISAQDKLQAEVTMRNHPIAELTAIAAIDPDKTQLFTGASKALKEQFGAIAVLN